MRDPNRIDEVLEQLKILWKEHPDQRLGQLISNTAYPSDIFNVEDDVMLKRINKEIDLINSEDIKL